MFPSKEVVRRLICARRHIGRWRPVPPVRETRKWLYNVYVKEGLTLHSCRIWIALSRE